jgi:hypothetical protein
MARWLAEAYPWVDKIIFATERQTTDDFCNRARS